MICANIFAIWHTDEGNWTIGNKEQVGQDNGYAVFRGATAASPDAEKRGTWEVYLGSDIWAKQENMKATKYQDNNTEHGSYWDHFCGDYRENDESGICDI